jgi:hypothetical protein
VLNRASSIGTLAALLLTATVAWADQPLGARRAEARRLGYAGIAAYEAKDYRTAEAHLSEAYRLLPAPSLGLWLARVLKFNGKWVEAARRYEEIRQLRVDTGDAAIQRAAREQAASEYDALMEVVPTVKLELTGADWREIEVTVNGARIDPATAATAIRLDVGTHIIVVRRGEEAQQFTASVSAREHERVNLDFDRSTSLRAFAYPAWALGALGLGTFLVSGTLGRLDEQALSDDCPVATATPAEVGPGVCFSTEIEARESDYKTKFLIGDVGLVTAIAGAAAGTILYLATDAPGSGEAERWGAGLSLAGIGAAGVTSFVWLTMDANSKNQSLGDDCSPRCSEGRKRSVDDRYTVANISLGAGILALAGATWVWLSDDAEDATNGAGIKVSLDGDPQHAGLQLSGSF